MKSKCAFCDKPEYMPKWFVCPSYIYRPNLYSVCEEHQNLSLTWDDVYPDEGGPAITRHEYKTGSSTNG